MHVYFFHAYQKVGGGVSLKKISEVFAPEWLKQVSGMKMQIHVHAKEILLYYGDNMVKTSALNHHKK